MHRRRTCSRQTSSVSHRESFPPPPPLPVVVTRGDDKDDRGAGGVTVDVDAAAAAPLVDERPLAAPATGTLVTAAVGGSGRAT